MPLFPRTLATIYGELPIDGDIAVYQGSNGQAQWGSLARHNLLGANGENLVGTWTGVGVTRTTLAMTEDGGVGTQHKIFADFAATAGKLYEVSAIVKAENRHHIQLLVNNSASFLSYFDITAGAVALGTQSAPAPSSRGIEDLTWKLGAGWYRPWIRFTYTFTETLYVQILGADVDNNLIYDGNSLLQFSFKRIRVYEPQA